MNNMESPIATIQARAWFRVIYRDTSRQRVRHSQNQADNLLSARRGRLLPRALMSRNFGR